MEEMEVDEFLPNDPESRRTKRNFSNCQENQAGASGSSKALNSLASRVIVKPRRRIEKVVKNILVIDTNVLLHDLARLKQILQSREKYNIIEVIIPLTVIDELDYRKKQFDQTSANAKAAIAFINNFVKEKCPFLNIKKEHDLEVQQNVNDDKIISTCVHFSTMHANKFNVILLTNDKNMQNKASAFKIRGESLRDFEKRFSRSSKQLNISCPEVPSASSPAPPLPDNAPGPSQLKKARLSLPATVTTSAKADPHRRQVVLVSKETPPSEKPSRKMPVPARPPKISTQPVKTSETSETVRKKLNNWISTTATEIFGEKWKQLVFPTFDPVTASLRDGLLLLKQNWMGTFSNGFQRDPQVLLLIKQLLAAKGLSNEKNLKKFNDLLNK